MNEKKAFVLGMLITFITLSTLIGSLQLSYHEVWVQDITEIIKAEQMKCDKIIQHLEDSKDGYMINLESSTEDKLVFTLDKECFKLKNNSNFIYMYRLKNLYFKYILSWFVILIASFIIGYVSHENASEPYRDDTY